MMHVLIQPAINIFQSVIRKGSWMLLAAFAFMPQLLYQASVDADCCDSAEYEPLQVNLPAVSGYHDYIAVHGSYWDSYYGSIYSIDHEIDGYFHIKAEPNGVINYSGSYMDSDSFGPDSGCSQRVIASEFYYASQNGVPVPNIIFPEEMYDQSAFYLDWGFLGWTGNLPQSRARSYDLSFTFDDTNGQASLDSAQEFGAYCGIKYFANDPAVTLSGKIHVVDFHVKNVASWARKDEHAYDPGNPIPLPPLYEINIQYEALPLEAKWIFEDDSYPNQYTAKYTLFAGVNEVATGHLFHNHNPGSISFSLYNFNENEQIYTLKIEIWVKDRVFRTVSSDTSFRGWRDVRKKLTFEIPLLNPFMNHCPTEFDPGEPIHPGPEPPSRPDRPCEYSCEEGHVCIALCHAGPPDPEFRLLSSISDGFYQMMFGNTGVKRWFALSLDEQVWINNTELIFFRGGRAYDYMKLEETGNEPIRKWFSYSTPTQTAFQYPENKITIDYGRTGQAVFEKLTGMTYHQISSRTYSDGNTVTYSYDNQGKLLSVSDDFGTLYTLNWEWEYGQKVLKSIEGGGIDSGRSEYSWTDDVMRFRHYNMINGTPVLAKQYDVGYSNNRHSYTTEYYITTAGLTPRPTAVMSYDANGKLVQIARGAQNWYIDGLNWISPDGSVSRNYRINTPTPTGTPGNAGYAQIHERYGPFPSPGSPTPTPIIYSESIYDASGMIRESKTGFTNRRSTAQYEYGYDSTSEGTYDELFRLVRVADTLGDYTRYTYDENGRVIESAQWDYVSGGSDVKLSESRSDYDGLDRIIRSYVTNPQGTPISETSRGYIPYFTWGDSTPTPQLTGTQTPTPTINPHAGELSWTEDGEGRRTEFSYDTYGNMSEVSIGNAITRFLYNEDTGQQTQVTSPEGLGTEYEYYVGGNLKKVRQYGPMPGAGSPTPTPLAVTEYQYDELNFGRNLVEVRDAEGYKTTYQYDLEGRITGETLWSGKVNPTPVHTAVYAYQSGGMQRLEYKKDFKGQKVSFEYDPIGRLRRKTWHNASPTPTPVLSLEYVYDEYGQVDSVEVDNCGSGCNGTIDYDYDLLGRLVARPGVDAGFDAIGYGYDAASRLSELTYPIGASSVLTRRWGYDRAGRVTEVQEDSSPVAFYTYNKASQRTRADYASGAATTWSYDATYGHLSAITHYNAASEVALSFEYAYNLDGLRTRVDREDGTYTLYEYDHLNRLKDEWKRTAQGNLVYRKSYGYDRVGNRLWKQHLFGDIGLSYSYQYNGLGQLSLMIETTPGGEYNHYYSYDANGNLTGRIRQVPWAPESWSYSWDVQDRLIKVVRDLPGTSDDRRVEYRYCPSCGGALTERIEYNATTGGTVLSWLRYEYEGLNLLRIDERYDNDSPPNGIDASDPWRPMNVYVHAPGSIGQIIKARWYKYDSMGANPMAPCETGEYYYLYDAVGNVIGVLEDGIRFYRWEMDAFGNSERIGGGMSGNNFLPMNHPGPKEHLTGKLYDTTTGLYYFHARWYDPLVGRFISKDEVDSIFQKYILSWASPSNYVDSDGMLPFFPPSAYREERNPIWFAKHGEFKLSRKVTLKSPSPLNSYTQRYSCFGQPRNLKTASARVKGLPKEISKYWVALSIKQGFHEGQWSAKCRPDPMGEFILGDCICSIGEFGYSFARAHVRFQIPGPPPFRWPYPIPGFPEPEIYEWISEGKYFIPNIHTAPACVVGGEMGGAGCDGW